MFLRYEGDIIPFRSNLFGGEDSENQSDDLR